MLTELRTRGVICSDPLGLLGGHGRMRARRVEADFALARGDRGRGRACRR